ncbi:phosphoribosylanthranilate isomerase [Niabella yanshanensis]|uniref:N-(5'-phosphoribosyl)anthranilate isomerase n=1 Tax=Niabella yanshanensis TaxID=577386 RepID=A0ABZ0WB08_9BACT|nr:phosphoribosylanthranilate isomerase [Niabella yanshanensis]WQD39814.1 phosphoribosylanthranilate isomerase [Niabella yanshanensis]
MNQPRIKVCGMTSIQQVQELAALGVDYAGFIFYEGSPRFVGSKIAGEDLKSLTGIQKVGVFVNETVEAILQAAADFGLNAVQLHGDEAPELCKTLLDKVKVIKAFRVRGDETALAELLASYEDSVDYFLFDTRAQEYGGTGKQFDWSVLTNTSINKPYFLSGGIGADDVEQVKGFIKTNNVFSLDVNSKFEIEPGVKDMERVKHFIQDIQ